MNDQSDNDEHLKETDDGQSNLTHPANNDDENKNNETIDESTTEIEPKTENVAAPSNYKQEVVSVNPLSNDIQRVSDPNISNSDAIESIGQEEESDTLREMVGDDFSKKSEVNILCECEPNVAGAAVPKVKSFTPDDKPSIKCNSSNCKLIENDLKQNSISAKSGINLQKQRDLIKHVARIRQRYKDEVKDKPNSESTNKKIKCSPQTGQCLKAGIVKQNSEKQNYPKKPSLIPKLARPSSSNSKCLEGIRDCNEQRENVTLKTLDTQKMFSKQLNNSAKTNEPKLSKQVMESCESDSKNEKTPLDHDDSKALSNANNISTRMLGLQEKLKATTSMLKQIEMDNKKEKTSPETNSDADANSSMEVEINKDESVPNKKTIEDLYKSIFCLENIASTFLENVNLKSQTRYIERFISNISEIKLIADKLCMHGKSKQDVIENSSSKVMVEKEKSTKASVINGKDNKIYIKFMHAKDKKTDNKKKSKELCSDQLDEVQAGVSLGFKMTSDSLNSDSCVPDKAPEETKIKEADSMDGIFIPSFEPPTNMEEDEETNGLDITITFPEFSQLYSNGTESHLSVCLSDISAEALRKLKRCPKDFTLKMDFVEGKVLFQSGRSPPNNFQIGPDLKFSENFVDTKKSDVISIKPSTECSFGSQLIPVCDNPKEIKSFKSLKSTDSELFNVVSLPFLYKNPYLATSHKSCMAFRNDQIMSMALMAKHFFKSMPQIPSLTNIFEDKLMDNPSKTDSRKKTQKSTESKKMDQRQ